MVFMTSLKPPFWNLYFEVCIIYLYYKGSHAGLTKLSITIAGYEWLHAHYL